jgi:hypothetical protein
MHVLSWWAFVSSLPCSAHSDVLWKKLQHMSGKYSWTSVPGVSLYGAIYPSKVNIANATVSNYNYDLCCTVIKDNTEALPLNF